MATFISKSPEMTESLGAEWARIAPEGLIVGLEGDLGSGKTALTRGFARGLGFFGRVHSPTFALLNEYQSPGIRLYHLDLYRLNLPAEIFSTGLDQIILQPGGRVVVEWINRLGAVSDVLEIFPSIKLRHAKFSQPSETERLIVYEDFGF